MHARPFGPARAALPAARDPATVVAMGEPAYTRMQVDERRRQLLELGRSCSPGTPSASCRWRGSRVRRGSRRRCSTTTSRASRTSSSRRSSRAPRSSPADGARPGLPPLEALAGSLDAFLGWIEENETAYRKLMESASVPEVRALIDQVGGPRPGSRRARRRRPAAAEDARGARGWLWFMDGAILDWLEHRDLERAELRDLLLGSLAGSLSAAAPPSGPALDPALLAALDLLLPDRRLGLDPVDDLARAREGLAAVRRRHGHDHARLRERHLADPVLDRGRAQPVALERLGGDRAMRSSAISA